ncbi:MAG: PEP-CTERM system TPR-repeat protein PrsT, partial [Nitrospirota bacterium]|nr:PEP-CTERM system TPR-repeat protein PrsT [Nitrospirota bacterium]
ISAKIILANVYMAGNKFEQAEAIAKEVLAADSRNKSALYLLTAIKQEQADIDGIISVYQKIIDNDPKDIMARLRLGLAYLQKKDIEKAREVADKLRKSYPEKAEGLYLMGMIKFQEKKIDEAIVLLQESLKNTSNPGANYYLGLCHFSKGDLEQATSEFQKVVDMRPDMAQARLLLAVTHLKKGRAKDAERETKKVLETDDKNAFAHNLLGSAYLSLGKGDLAMEEFDRAIELNPGLVDAHIKKGAFNLLSGEKEKAEKEFVNAVKIAPDMLNTRIILAQYYIKNRQFENAIKILNEGLKENPNDAILYNIMGAAYLGAEKMDNAVKYFEKAISSNSGFYLPYFNLARVYLNTNDKEKAKAEYKRVLGVDDKNLPALLMLAKIMETDKNDKEALYYYNRAKEQKKSLAYISLAGYYQRKKDNKKAIEVLDEALSIEPGNINVMDMKGRIYIASKDYNNALSVYADMEKVSPEAGAERIAEVNAAMDDYDTAINKFKGILSRNAERTDILTKIVGLSISKKDYGEAERNARQVIERLTGSDSGYLLLAEVHIADRQFQKAIDALKKAEAISPDNIKTKIMIGKTYIAAREFQMALNIFEKLERSYPKYAPVYFFHASTLEMMGMKKTAVEKHAKALEVSPNYAPSLNNLAYLYTEGYGPIDKAADMAKKAKEIAPRDGSITDTLGWVLYNKGDYDEALKCFIEATHYMPGEPNIRYHLGLAYLKKGMDVKAEEQLKNAVRLGRLYDFPNNNDARDLLEGIKRK